ncbi:MAG: hypothetical protein K8H87_17835 [Pseudorhodoplanes sp.]|nr:MAG: hypothetical protein F9K38_10785 [Pseudorhodoplanes sp.]MBZ0141606.1 hypothetical protein [Pseudorhodoplanes sp.]
MVGCEMSGSVSRIFSLAFALLCVAPSTHAASWIEKNSWMSGPRYSGRVPACDNAWALSSIQWRFAHKEGRYWHSGLRIVSVERIHETAFRPWSPDAIPRRFCSGTALISDGVRRPIHYLIAEDLGPIGAIFGVQWCVVGLDRNLAYAPACRAARP